MIISIFRTIKDHRVTGRCLYPLSDLLTIALLTYLCGGEDYVDMSDFAESRARSYGLLKGCETSPSPDTFERLMRAVSPAEIERCLMQYGKQFLDTLVEKQVAIDGKKLRGTRPTSKGTQGDYLLNAFVCENELVIGQMALQNKENEITAIPNLLNNIDITGATVTIDAIGTQVNIAQQILDKGADYMLAAKDNQKFTRMAIAETFSLNPKAIIDQYSDLDGGHGRVEERVCQIMRAESMVDNEIEGRWPGLKTFVKVTSKVSKGDTTEESVRYYISSDDYPKAKYYYLLARGHWGIENQLHWHLDVTFHEDASRARMDYAPQNLSLIRKMALQIIKNHPDKKRSLRKKIFHAAMDCDYLTEIIKNALF